MTYHIWLILAVAAAAAIFAFLCYRWEKREWNNGVCRKNGIEWRLMGVDSTGARGYKAGDEVTWIDYPGVDVFPKQTEIIQFPGTKV